MTNNDEFFELVNDKPIPELDVYVPNPEHVLADREQRLRNIMESKTIKVVRVEVGSHPTNRLKDRWVVRYDENGGIIICICKKDPLTAADLEEMESENE